MCGIVGGSYKKWDYESGIKSLAHRGPDGCRIEKLKDCTLAFARLAIMDLNVRAMQPMHSEDKDVWMAYNGEIYNFKPLRKELQKKYIFHTMSDSEVILNAYLEYGDDFIEHIDGMFAIAIYDARSRELKLYRDRMGIKPLYYYFKNGQIAFASELKALEAALSDEVLDLDYTALYDYLFYRYIPTPKTMYKNCFKLPPAHRLVYSFRTKKIEKVEKYWKLHVNTSVGRKRKKEDVQEALHYYIEKSVREQLVADVPVGTYLSGGIDSSIITYHCHEFDQDIMAFSIGFQDKKYDETKYAELMKDRYDIRFLNKVLDKNNIYSRHGMMRKWYDEPYADTSAYPSYELSKMAREHVTVVLTGDGGDELFGGYPSCQDMKRTAGNVSVDKIKDRLFQAIYRSGYDFDYDGKWKALFHIFIGSRGANKNKEIEELAHKWDIPKDYDILWYFKKFYVGDLPPMTRSRYLDFKTYMHDDVLTKVDRVSMAVSLEARIPFLSRELVEYAFSLSEEECCPDMMLKGALKEAYQKLIPKEILYRKKQGFNVPAKYLGSERKEISVSILKNEWNMI